MFLTLTGPGGHQEHKSYDTQGLNLGTLLGDNAKNVDACLINGRLWDNDQWPRFVPRRSDHVEIVGNVGDVTGFIIGLIISIALSAIVRALTPQPKKAKGGKRGEAFGIAGFNNTTGPGTPIPVPYGRNRIFGHVISSGASISADGKNMEARVLYVMGDTGGDQVESIDEIELDEIDASQYEGMQVHTRLGSNTQTVIPEFENVDQLWHDGRTLPYDEETESGTPIVYRTHSNTIQRMTLHFDFPGGLFRFNKSGNFRPDEVNIKVELKKSSEGDGSYTEVFGSPVKFVERTQSQIFKSFVVETAVVTTTAADAYWALYPDVAADPFFGATPLGAWTHYIRLGRFEGREWPGDQPTGEEWDIRLTVIDQHRGPNEEAHSTTVALFNVEETQFTTESYPGFALLGLTGIPAKQIRSLEAMRVSALVEGKRVKVPQPGGGTVLQYTRKRCWIVRDMMTHPIVGMGSEIDEDEIDDDQWQESQDYYDELVPAQDGGQEVRDLCDVVVNESRWDWEWVKGVAGEGRGRIVPSGLKWKYVLDAPGNPNLLYAEPGNIIQDSIQIEHAPPDRPFNQVLAEFRDGANDYKPDVSEPINDPDQGISIIQEPLRYETITRESEVMRENMIVLKRAVLERRRWSFVSPIGAIVSEPMDLDWLGERVIGNQGSYSGFLPAGCTTTLILLPDLVTIEAGETYLLIVRHQSDNTVESRTVSTGAGKWASVTVSSAFTEAPRERDIFALGIQNVDHTITRALELELDQEGRVKQTRVEYVPAIYTPDQLPPRRTRRRFQLQHLPPIPLRDAQVAEEVVLNRDGTQRSNIIFNVTPGLPKHAGEAQGGSLTDIILDIVEPTRDDYFKGADLRIPAGGYGSGLYGKGVYGVSMIEGLSNHRITGYIGTEQRALVSPDLHAVPIAGTEYEIEWPRFGIYSGFEVEMSEDGVEWNPLATFHGTEGEIDGREQKGTTHFRFTPFSESVVRNETARIVRTLTLVGDLSAPAPPASVAMSSQFKNVTVEIAFTRPVAEDLAGVEIECYRTSIGGTLIKTLRISIPQDNATSGQLIVRPGFEFVTENYDAVIIARARAVDRSNNASAFVNALSGTTLTRAGTEDLSENIASDTTESANDASAEISISGTELLSISHTVDSDEPVLLWAKAVLRVGGTLSNPVMGIELRRGVTIGGALLDKTEVTVTGDPNVETVVPMSLLKVDGPGNGVHTYKVWGTTDAPSGFAFASFRRLMGTRLKR